MPSLLPGQAPINARAAQQNALNQTAALKSQLATAQYANYGNDVPTNVAPDQMGGQNSFKLPDPKMVSGAQLFGSAVTPGAATKPVDPNLPPEVRASIQQENAAIQAQNTELLKQQQTQQEMDAKQMAGSATPGAANAAPAAPVSTDPNHFANGADNVGKGTMERMNQRIDRQTFIEQKRAEGLSDQQIKEQIASLPPEQTGGGIAAPPPAPSPAASTGEPSGTKPEAPKTPGKTEGKPGDPATADPKQALLLQTLATVTAGNPMGPLIMAGVQAQFQAEQQAKTDAKTSLDASLVQDTKDNTDTQAFIDKCAGIAQAKSSEYVKLQQDINESTNKYLEQQKANDLASLEFQRQLGTQALEKQKTAEMLKSSISMALSGESFSGAANSALADSERQWDVQIQNLGKEYSFKAADVSANYTQKYVDAKNKLSLDVFNASTALDAKLEAYAGQGFNSLKAKEQADTAAKNAFRSQIDKLTTDHATYITGMVKDIQDRVEREQVHKDALQTAADARADRLQAHQDALDAAANARADRQQVHADSLLQHQDALDARADAKSSAENDKWSATGKKWNETVADDLENEPAIVPFDEFNNNIYSRFQALTKDGTLTSTNPETAVMLTDLFANANNPKLTARMPTQVIDLFNSNLSPQDKAQKFISNFMGKGNMNPQIMAGMTSALNDIQAKLKENAQAAMDAYIVRSIHDNSTIPDGYKHFGVDPTYLYHNGLDNGTSLPGGLGNTDSLTPRPPSKLDIMRGTPQDGSFSPSGPMSSNGGFLDVLAQAHQQHEGFFPGSRAYRNNNPGNLKYVGQAGATGKDSQGFAIFPDYFSGALALKQDLAAKITGKSSHIDYSKNPTLLDYVKVYAPSGDNNDPKGYASSLVGKLQKAGYHVDLNTQLSKIAPLLG